MTTPPDMPDMLGGFVLDTSALLELVAGPNVYAATFARMTALQGLTLLVPAAALSEAWQAAPNTGNASLRMELFLDGPMVVVEPLDRRVAVASRHLPRRPGAAPDVPAAHVVTACTARGWPALSADPARLHVLAPDLPVEKLPGT